MPTPDFVTELRTRVGHQPLWLSTAMGVVLDDDGRILLERRSDNGRWTLPGGIIDPAEQPADAAVREIFEETGVVAVPEALVAVTVSRPITYPNGDQVQYLEVTFRCRATGGTARVNDAESVEVGWHDRAALPELEDWTLGLLQQALSWPVAPAFSFSGISEVLGPLFPGCER
jgi:8-oxo-dGTP pyrophosphatase MutT (NUDIX family)